MLCRLTAADDVEASSGEVWAFPLPACPSQVMGDARAVRGPVHNSSWDWTADWLTRYPGEKIEMAVTLEDVILGY